MAEYKLGFYGEEIDLKLQQIEELRKNVMQLGKNDTNINAAIASINDAINELKNASSGAVKHTQRGLLSGMSGTTVDIALGGFTNADKMVVILNNAPFYDQDYPQRIGPYVHNLTAATLTIGVLRTAMDTATMSYQVIEFY